HAYKGSVTSSQDRSENWSIIEAATFYDLPPVIDRVGIWAVCTNGLHCLTESYFIESARFEEEDWVKHMAEKTWVDRTEFSAALSRAQNLKRLGYLLE